MTPLESSPEKKLKRIVFYLTENELLEAYEKLKTQYKDSEIGREGFRCLAMKKGFLSFTEEIPA